MDFLKIDLVSPLIHSSCGCFESDGNWIHKKRNIDSAVLIIGLQGTLYIQQGEKQYEVKPGNSLILLPNQEHFGFKKSTEKISYYWCHFYYNNSYELLNKHDLVKEILILKNSSSRYPHNTLFVPIFGSYEHLDRVNILFRQLLHTACFNQYTKFQTNYILTTLMIEITELVIVEQYKSFTEDFNDSRFETMLEWIRINICSNITVTDISKRFNYNPDYLSRIFKKRIGMTLIKYINVLRITMSKKLLACSDYSMKEIAYNVGFNDEKYFLKLFKAHENMTPTQFRNAYSNIHLNNQ